MKIKLQNIGIIKEADINIDGITLIAGQNDSGKSTVGKVLYSLVRGVNIDEERFNFSKNEFIRNKIRDIRNLLSRTKSTETQDLEVAQKYLKNFLSNDESLLGIYSFKVNSKDEESIQRVLGELSELSDLYENHSNSAIKQQLNNFIKDIDDRISIKIDSKDVLHYELGAFFENEFGNQIKNEFEDGDAQILIEGIKEKKITFSDSIYFEGFDSSTSFFYDEVFFIESPMKLEERGLYRPSNIFRDKNQYLNYKIFEEETEQDIFSDTSDKIEKLNLIISEIINGTLFLNSKKQLVFKKKGVEFQFGNVATGIKSFGVLQLLLEKGNLNSNTLLIIDEPEVHLHPTWQVKYAEILVRLSQEFAIPILLTSHSPYFIEALEAYSKKHNYADSTNFYFAQKNSNEMSSNIIDVTKDISPILTSISEAFYKIQDINDED